MQGVCVAHHGADGAHRLGGLLQKLGRLGHAVVQKKGLGALAHGIPEELAEVASVQPAEGSDVLHRHVPLVVLLNEGKRLLHIKVPQAALALVLPCRRGFHQLVQKQKAPADLPDGAGLAVLHDLQHALPQLFASGPGAGGVDGLCRAQARQAQALAHAQAIELDPGVLPGVLFVRGVGGGLARQNQKPLPRPHRIHLVAHIQLTLPGDDVMEQIVVAPVRPVGVQRLGALPPVLIQVQIHKAFVLKHVENQLVAGIRPECGGHIAIPPSFCPFF